MWDDLWPVIIGAIAAIVGGFGATIVTARANRKESARAAQRLAYGVVLRHCYDFERFRVDVQIEINSRPPLARATEPLKENHAEAAALVRLHGTEAVRDAYGRFNTCAAKFSLRLAAVRSAIAQNDVARADSEKVHLVHEAHALSESVTNVGDVMNRAVAP